jgi:hypothetical protein
MNTTRLEHFANDKSPFARRRFTFMFLREAVHLGSFVLLGLVVLSIVTYLQVTFSELTQERKGEYLSLTFLRWIPLHFMNSLIFLIAMPSFQLVSFLLYRNMDELSVFFSFSFLHIVVVLALVCIGGLPWGLVWQREIHNRTVFRIMEYGYLLYLVLIFGVGFLWEGRVSLAFALSLPLQNGWEIGEFFIVLLFSYIGVAWILLRSCRYVIRKWQEEGNRHYD